jgi:hypothetical protein
MNDSHLVKEAHSLNDLPQDLNSLGHGHWKLGAVFNLEVISEVGPSALQNQATQRRRRRGSRRDAITRGIEEEDVLLGEELGGGVQPVHKVAMAFMISIPSSDQVEIKLLSLQSLQPTCITSHFQFARGLLSVEIAKDSIQDFVAGEASNSTLVISLTVTVILGLRLNSCSDPNMWTLAKIIKRE